MVDDSSRQPSALDDHHDGGHRDQFAGEIPARDSDSDGAQAEKRAVPKRTM